jgi:hypothetical protein
MIRNFGLRSLPLVHRLCDRSVALHPELALTHDHHPLRGALLNLVARGTYPTYVWRADSGKASGFVQLHLDETHNHARIVYLAAADKRRPNGRDDSDIADNWLPLLEQVVAEVGHSGIHGLVAEAREIGPELPVLRQAGFAIYTRQDIWAATQTENQCKATIIPRKREDDWDIHLLYANIVPRLIQLVEPVPPLHYGNSWVLREGHELAAFIHRYDGPAASWLRLFVHPDLQTPVEDIVAAAVANRPPTPAHPVYCCVRRYQSWLGHHLAASGFSLWGGQAVMVKHTVQYTRQALPELGALLESQGLPGSSLMRHVRLPLLDGDWLTLRPEAPSPRRAGIVIQEPPCLKH